MKTIIGMIHLSGENRKEKITRALEELNIYQNNGIDRIIIENYHASIEDTTACTIAIMQKEVKQFSMMQLGVNILPNNYAQAFELAEALSIYRPGFIQLDHIAGEYYHTTEINEKHYLDTKLKYPEIKVYGGVWPKYYTPIKGWLLEEDLQAAMNRCDAIVVTGNATGIETPTYKIKLFREIIGNKELIIGAGLNKDNAYEQLSIANGAIVGSYFKNGNTNAKLDENRIKEIMDIANSL